MLAFCLCFIITAIALIVTLVRVACLCDRVRFLKFELEAASELLQRREERIAFMHKGCAAAEAEAGRQAACERVISDQLANALTMKSEAERKLTQIKMDSTKALEHFQAVLTNIFGADTCKPLEQRLREAFDKNGIREI